MSKGFCFVAQNNDTTDYVRQACLLAVSIHKFNNSQNISLITNDEVPKKYRVLFDKIIPIQKDDAETATKKMHNRCKMYELSPYTQTIGMDVDMLVMRDITNWWSYLKNYDLFFVSNVKTYRNETVTSTWHRKVFINNNLPNLYNGIFYFKKSKTAKKYFDLLKIITQNWETFYKIYSPIKMQNFYSVDVSTAIACKILGIDKKVCDPNSFISFVHMKPALQNWRESCLNWTDKVDWSVNNSKELMVDNFIQNNVFHYVEDKFLTDELIKELER